MTTILAYIGIGLIISGIVFIAVLTVKKQQQKRSIGVAAAVLGAVIFIFANSFVIIPTGYAGVKTTFGQISEASVPNGFNWKAPFIQSIKQVNCKQQDLTFNGEIWSETSNRTAVYYDGVTVTYQISSGKAAWIYANVSSYENNMVTQSLVASSIKSSSKTLSDEDATNRSVIEPLTQENLQSALNEKYGEGVIMVNKVTISNADFEDSYNEAIAAKQTAQLAYEQQQIENQKNIEAAEAEATVKKTQAQAEADAAVIQAQGEAEANELLNDSLSEKILLQMYLEKWDGVLPKVTSDGSGMILDIGSLTETAQTETEEE
ncbi:MAG: hypothetical protein LIP10_04065 [Clostridiales bacterium]|nr:hypothetical protein [Clostridiales bacterium]